jgi:glutamine amidotransferase
MKIGIINTNSGNLFSLLKILKDLECSYQVCLKPNDIKQVDKIIIPGVGAFDKTMNFLNDQLLTNEIKEQVIIKKKFLLGICMGMQILFESSSEGLSVAGLNLFDGQIVNLKEKKCNNIIPHIGWNSISIIKKDNPIMKNINNNTDFYFAHSFIVNQPKEKIVVSTTSYDIKFISSVSWENIFGVQFHPEKSSYAGRILIKNFLYL